MNTFSDKKTTVYELKKMLVNNISDRDWEENCYPTTLAKLIAISANELLKEFCWIDSIESWEPLIDPKSKHQISSKVADIIYHLIIFTEISEIDLVRCINAKRGVSKNQHL